MRLVPTETNPQALSAYAELFACCFPGVRKFNHAYLSWLYDQNPSGSVVGFDAWDGQRLAAHYACIPASAQLEGERVQVLLSLNTATHPDYQGKGLFTKLAEHTYQEAARRGIAAIYGVANANSTPGFVRKLGFQNVGPLEVRLGAGAFGLDASEAVGDVQFRRAWEPASLAWRCANPDNPVLHRRLGGRDLFYARAVGKLISVVAVLPSSEGRGHPASSGWLSPCRLFLGLAPESARRPAAAVGIPARLRPSPLNLIFRSLTGRTTSLDRRRLSFSFLDFDAY